jgi:hypothetical protein
MSQFNDVDILFVIPKAFGDEDQNTIKLIGANNISITKKSVSFKGFLKDINFIEVGSHLVPYVSEDEYFKLKNKKVNKDKELISVNEEGKIDFSGGYGGSLFQDIANYAYVAQFIGDENEFDIIHAHDWLTYPAGIAAKEVSGKPLVVHVHATDFDRSGGSVNPAVYEIEKKGMLAADKVLTVSNLTRQTVITVLTLPRLKLFIMPWNRSTNLKNTGLKKALKKR